MLKTVKPQQLSPRPDPMNASGSSVTTTTDTDAPEQTSLSMRQRFLKRTFDLVVSVPGLLLVSPIILVGWIAATISTRRNGFFVQQRVGQGGRLFPMIKLRSMKSIPNVQTHVTTSDDQRITRTGAVLRKFKIDELPQLINVILGQMSLVGPRPDVLGFADELTGEDRVILSVKPGITGPATLVFRNEEEILASVDHPEDYNQHVIWPEKVRINKDYIQNYSLFADIVIIKKTLFGGH